MWLRADGKDNTVLAVPEELLVVVVQLAQLVQLVVVVVVVVVVVQLQSQSQLVSHGAATSGSWQSSAGQPFRATFHCDHRPVERQS